MVRRRKSRRSEGVVDREEGENHSRSSASAKNLATTANKAKTVKLDADVSHPCETFIDFRGGEFQPLHHLPWL